MKTIHRYNYTLKILCPWAMKQDEKAGDKIKDKTNNSSDNLLRN